jgi:hypothetical protein
VREPAPSPCPSHEGRGTHIAGCILTAAMLSLQRWWPRLLGKEILMGKRANECTGPRFLKVPYGKIGPALVNGSRVGLR